MVNKVARGASILTVALIAVLGTALPAFAIVTPAPAPTGTQNYVEYDGSAHTFLETGQPLNTSFPTHVRITCTNGDCVLGGFSLVGPTAGGATFDVTQGRHLVLIDGKGTFTMAAHGAPCDIDWIGAGTLTIAATATSYTATRTSASGGGPVSCNDNSDADLSAFVIKSAGTFTDGRPCVLDGSCPTPTPTAAALVSAPSASSSSTRLASPSTLSTLPSATTALTVRNALWAAAITVVLVLLVAFPTHLFNTATGEGADRAKAWWAKRRPKLPAGLAKAREVEYKGWPLAAAGVLIASLISSFVDPAFGFNASSVRVYLSILTSFLLDAVAGWFLLIYLVRRARPHTTATFRFAPASLLVVLAAVIFTRVTGFAPGIVFGLVAGVAFGAVLATTEKARIALVGLGYSFVVAIIGWVGYSTISSTVGAHPSAGIVFLHETLSSMAIGGIAALPIALVPLRGLTGYDIFSWNRWVWGGAYAIGLLGFFLVLMPLPFSWTGVHINLVVWIAVYVAYGLVAVIAWLIVVRPWKRPTEAAPTDSPESA